MAETTALLALRKLRCISSFFNHSDISILSPLHFTVLQYFWRGKINDQSEIRRRRPDNKTKIMQLCISDGAKNI